MKKLRLINELLLGGIFSALFFFILAQVFNSLKLEIIALLTLTIAWCIYYTKNIFSNMVIILFEISFIMFLSGTIILSFLQNKETILLGEFSKEINNHIVSTLFISQFFFPLGFLWANNKREHVKVSEKIQTFRDVSAYRKISAIGILITILPQIIVSYVNAKVQVDLGYVASYLGYETNISAILIRLARGYTVFFWIYLMSKPQKSKAYIVLIVNFLIACIRASGGHRSYIILAGLSSIMYLCYRQIEDSDITWFKSIWILYIIVLIPIIIVFFVNMAYTRINMVVDYSFVDYLSEFFESSSANVIGYGKVYSDRIPDGIYTIGGLFTVMIRNQSIVGSLFGFEVLKNHTLNMALYGRSFGQTITYLANSSIYFRGGGLGSSYIAETFHDFGYVGLIVINVMLGVILSRLYNYKNDSVWIKAIQFMMLESLMLLPRENTFSFIYANITTTNIGYFLITYLLVYMLKNQKIE